MSELNKAIGKLKTKIKDKVPEYIETTVNGKVYRTEVIQLEMRFTEETAKNVEILVSTIEQLRDKLNKDIEEYKLEMLKIKDKQKIAKENNNLEEIYRLNQYAIFIQSQLDYANSIKEIIGGNVNEINNK